MLGGNSVGKRKFDALKPTSDLNLGAKCWRLKVDYKWLRHTDREILKSEFEHIERIIGRTFSFDAAASDYGDNAMCNSYASPSKSFMKLTNLSSDDCVWMNAPFHRLNEFISHYRSLKANNPSLSACILVPKLTSDADWKQSLGAMNAELILEYPKGYQLFCAPSITGERKKLPGIPWPVEIYWDPPLIVEAKTAIRNMMPKTDDANSMMFEGLVAGTYARILLDTGATHNFLDGAMQRRLGLKLLPTQHASVSFADNSTARLKGECRVKIKIGKMTAQITALVLDDMSQCGDLILGDPFLIKHDVMLRPAKCTALVNCGNRRATIRSIMHGLFEDEPSKVDSDPRNYYIVVYVISDPNSHEVQLRAYAHGEIKKGPLAEERLQHVLTNFADVFEPLPAGLPPDRQIDHLIPLIPGAKPVAKPVYKLTPKEEEEARKQITEMLAKGWISPSQSPWAAPILFAPKPDGGLRLCVDYRALNRQTVKNSYPMPRADVLLDKLKGAKVFSSIDLQAGYHQIKIDRNDVPLTGFRCNLGHFEYNVMCFGLTNAPATFQKVMNNVFKRQIEAGFVMVYLDDILIYSKNAEEHEQHLKEVLEAMRTHKLYAKSSKCEWNRTEVTFLGHLVSADGVRMDPKKTATVVDWPTPKTQTELRSFLGLANYFRRFLMGYASVAAPLHELLKKASTVQLTWLDKHEEAFQLIKKLISADIVLQYPDFDAPFELISDASLLGTGAVLLQNGKPIAYTSKKFLPAEKNYTTGEQELLGVINALKEWRCYLEGPEVTVVTDHHPLTYLQTSAPLSRRQARWLEFMQRFHVTWEYRPGRLNIADPLSRHPNLLSVMRSPALYAIHIASHTDQSFRQKIVAAYANDPWFRNPDNLKELTLKNDLWYKLITTPGAPLKSHSVIVIPDCLEIKDEIITNQHTELLAGHPGRDKTLELIQRSYWWPSMRADVEQFVSRCDSCQRNKALSRKPAGTLNPLPIPVTPWESVGIDFIVGLPRTKQKNDAIIVFIDRLTKMVHLAPTTIEVSATQTADLFVWNVVKLHGMPKDTVTDRGPQFAGNFWKSLLAQLGAKAKLSTAYHPQTDGQTERTNKTVGDMLRNYCDTSQSNWDEHLPLIEFAINNSASSATQQSPFYLNYGYHPRTPAFRIDSDHPTARQTAESLASRLQRAKHCLQAARERMKAYYDRKHVPQSFLPGEQVLLSTKNLRLTAPRKLMPKYIGPFTILDKIGEQAYRLQLPEQMTIHNVFHTSLLRPYKSDGTYQPPPIDWDDNNSPLWEVDKLLDHMPLTDGKKKSYKYLVRWKGYTAEHDTWEPESQFSDDSMIKAYWASRAEKHPISSDGADA